MSKNFSLNQEQNMPKPVANHPTATENILLTKGLTYCYQGDKPAIDKLDFAVAKGSVTAVLGGNGAGKSTLFLNLNGVLKPNQGKVYFAGEKVVYNTKGIKNLRKQVGIVFQDPNDQLFSASVRQDIAFGALNLGIDPKEVGRLVVEVAEQTGVTAFLDRPTHGLSFGQKKRVAIAGVLIMQPQVIILDEPTAGLDPKGVSEILNLLSQINQERGISVVLSTHEIDLVPLYCDYAYVMAEGKMVMQGLPGEIFVRAQELRSYSLRLPRLNHLMEIMQNKDGLAVDREAATISQVRTSLKELLQVDEKE